MIPNFSVRFFGNALEVNADGGEEVPVWESEAPEQRSDKGQKCHF